jgi:hypothetical protein
MSPEATPTTRRSRRRLLTGCTLAAAAVITAITLLAGLAFYPQWSSLREIKKKQRALLVDTDPAALLAGCRAAWENRSAFGPGDTGSIAISPSDPRLPPAILALNAHSIDAFPSGLHIELGGQWCHYGFETFANNQPDEKRMVWKNEYPSTELTPGLWFYAENGLPQTK